MHVGGLSGKFMLEVVNSEFKIQFDNDNQKLGDRLSGLSCS